AREAISGTTPPNGICFETELKISFDKICLPPLITAQAVSSQLDSIAKIRAYFLICAFNDFSK
ncbi:MAG: hypothetical protein J6R29_02660, partial [Clostridia bacterium]|nr:hypothetical protein [Clostridia bacterium]